MCTSLLLFFFSGTLLTGLFEARTTGKGERVKVKVLILRGWYVTVQLD